MIQQLILYWRRINANEKTGKRENGKWNRKDEKFLAIHGLRRVVTRGVSENDPSGVHQHRAEVQRRILRLAARTEPKEKHGFDEAAVNFAPC